MEDFDAWYERLRPAMGRSLTAWCGDAGLAEEAVDEAFVRALERWERVRRLDAPAGWLWRTASNVAKRRSTRRRAERRALDRLGAGTATERPGPGPDDVDLRHALLELTERQRTAIVLHYVADLPLREVAAAMGIAEGTVAATLHQSRARLAEVLAGSIEAPTRPTSIDHRPDGAVP